MCLSNTDFAFFFLSLHTVAYSLFMTVVYAYALLCVLLQPNKSYEVPPAEP